MLYLFLDHRVFWDLAIEWKYLLEMNLKQSVKIINQIPNTMDLDLVIMFGLNHYNGQMPKNYILVQLEQSPESGWFGEKYLELIKNALVVWDYSFVNYQKLNQYNKQYYCLTLGYGTQWIINNNRHTNNSCDVLFMGQLNPRRQLIIDQLRSNGIICHILENSWGKERLDQINGAKLIINIHFYPTAILETVRLSYLLSLGKPVISESSCDYVLDCQYGKYIELVDYQSLVEATISIIKTPEKIETLLKKSQAFLTLKTNLPIDKISSKLNNMIQSPESVKIPSVDDYSQLDQLIANSNDIQQVKQSIKNGSLVLHLNKYEDDDLPHVSIITITKNRKHLFQMPIRNWTLFEYPTDKLEWIIVDDSTDDSDLTDILPNDPRIHYFKLNNQKDIGYKRNFAIKQTKYNYICMMDDDDYYYPISIYSRIAVLLSNPQYSCVGVTDLDVYDIKNNSCARFISPYLSEASMAFTKYFWEQQPFSEKEHSLGEGYPFTKNRRNLLIKMPSCFNLIAITHGQNWTGDRRRIEPSHRIDILKQLDLDSKLFLFQWL